MERDIKHTRVKRKKKNEDDAKQVQPPQREGDQRGKNNNEGCCVEFKRQTRHANHLRPYEILKSNLFLFFFSLFDKNVLSFEVQLMQRCSEEKKMQCSIYIERE